MRSCESSCLQAEQQAEAVVTHSVSFDRRKKTQREYRCDAIADCGRTRGYDQARTCS